MAKYVVFQVPYQEKESAFLLHVVQTAVKAHREFDERSTLATELQTDPVADGSPDLHIKEEMDGHQPTPTLRSLF